jgi:tetratricopeptide (TPR) repeat protein
MSGPQTPSTHTRTSPMQIGALALLLAIITAGVYWNSLKGQLVFDDEPIVAGAKLRPVFWPLNSWLHNRRSIVELSWNLNHALVGSTAFHFHAVNLVIHAAAVVFLFLLARRLLASPLLPQDIRRYATGLAFTLALLWGVHPLNTEAVTFVTQRFESLAGMFILLALLLTAKAAQIHENAANTPGASPLGSPLKKAGPWLIAATLAALLAIFSKETAVGIGVLALLMDRAFITGAFRQTLRRRGWLYALMLALPALYLATQAGITDAVTSDPGQASAAGLGSHTTPFTWVQYLFAQGGAILYYFRLAVWPHPLCFDYFDWLPAPRLVYDLPAAAVVGLLVIATFRAVFKRPAIGFLGAVFFVILAPSSSIMPIRDIVAEHRMYISLIPVIALIIVGAWRLIHRLAHTDESRRTAGSAALFVVLLIAVTLGSLTLLRNADYADALVLLKKTVEVRPRNPRPYHNMAAILVERHDRPTFREDAMWCLERATDYLPEDTEGHLFYARLAMEIGRPDLAIARYKLLLTLKPRESKILLRLGLAYMKTGELGPAIESFDQAIAAEPGLADAHGSKALALLMGGRNADAIVAYRRALELAPNEVSFMIGLARALAASVSQADQSEAGEFFRRVTQSHPHNAAAWAGWGSALVDWGDVRAGLPHLEKALALQPSNIDYQRRLAWAIAVDQDATPEQAARAVGLANNANNATDASLPLMLDTLGAAYARLGRFDDAVRHAKLALEKAKQFDQQALITPITQRLALYELRKAYSLKR